MGSFGVVGVLEFQQLLLQVLEGLCGWFGCQPSFLGLVKTFDFPLGLGVTGGPVFLANTQCCEEVFETVAASGEAGGVNTSIVSQRGRWRAVILSVLAESVDHDLAGDAPVGVQGE